MGFVADAVKGVGNTVTGALGLGKGKGAQFRAEKADLLDPFKQGQLSESYGQAQSGIQQQQNFINALNAQNGIGNQSSVFGQQQGLANMLGAQAMGYGPNPALAQLHQTTGQNIANQAALMAGQRGSNANVGLLGRQIAQQGAGIQQNAVGQAAVLRAQQQLAAQQALGQQQAQMANLATNQVGQLGSGIGGYNQIAQNEQSNLGNMLANYNNAQVSNLSQANGANAGIQNTVAKKEGDFISGGIKSLGSAVGLAGLGGVGGLFAQGGEVGGGPRSNVGKMFSMQSGGKVPGSAQAQGDSYKNDTVPALLSPGEIVIPRSITKSDEPIEKSAKFVQAILAKSRMKK